MGSSPHVGVLVALVYWWPESPGVPCGAGAASKEGAIDGALQDAFENFLKPFIVVMIEAGRMGHYRLGAEEGQNGEGTAFVPTPSAAVYDQFEDAVQACLYGREPRLP